MKESTLDYHKLILYDYSPNITLLVKVFCICDLKLLYLGDTSNFRESFPLYYAFLDCSPSIWLILNIEHEKHVRCF